MNATSKKIVVTLDSELLRRAEESGDRDSIAAVLDALDLPLLGKHVRRMQRTRQRDEETWEKRLQAKVYYLRRGFIAIPTEQRKLEIRKLFGLSEGDANNIAHGSKNELYKAAMALIRSEHEASNRP